MAEPRDPGASRKEQSLRQEVGAREARKLKAQRHAARNVWFGLGMFGLVGWSVVVPTLAGIVLGIWLDRHGAGTHSWTLTLLFVGLALGCWNAWHWISRERRQMHENGEDGS